MNNKDKALDLAISVLEDIANYGTRHDLHPTCVKGPSGELLPGGQPWTLYIERMDGSVRSRARGALQQIYDHINEEDEPEKPTTDLRVVVIQWIESEKGWGQRPDGYSIHCDTPTARKYQDDHHRLMKELDAKYGDGAGDYTFPAKEYVGVVDEETYAVMMSNGGTTRFFHNRYPPEYKL